MRPALPALLLVLLAPPALPAGPPGDFRPDPLSVRRHGPAYRYPQAGWTVLHIEGEPYERGYQHGRLMASEIAAFVRCFAAAQSPKAPADGWRQTRTLVNALFLRRTDREYLEEMKGIADGASAAGARFDGRPLDLVDVAALNAWAEVETLGAALEATPTGLEGVRFPGRQPRAPPPPQPMHCSAFAATGPATADGKIVFGHITMFGLYPSNFYNVWLDVRPAKGHRVLMQSYPGGIQSGMDYYMNDAGLLVCETTIRQTRFDITGASETSRIRKALQYADGIDRAVEILKEGNNGLYTNEWLLADTKTNEIAMFELGTHQTRLYRSSKHEWFGGTEGFYWGCNNAKDRQLRLETLPSVRDRPANLVWRPSDRDQTWQRLYHQYKGKIDADFGKLAFTTPPLAAAHSLDAKFTTTELARDLKSWALFGPPLGRTWQPTPAERQKYPEIRPLVSNPWTVLHADAPARAELAGKPPVDLAEQVAPDRAAAKTDDDGAELSVLPEDDERLPPTLPAWHGTVLPRTDADVWLAAAFADYEKIVAMENVLRQRRADGKLTRADRDRLAVELYAHRSSYLAAARVIGDVPLAKTRAEVGRDHWYRVAAGKGVLALHELRRSLGDEKFARLMDEFGRAHAGREVSAADFAARAGKPPAWPDGGPVGEPGGGVYSILSFMAELDQSLIVYGTADEVAANREAAEALQRAVRERWSNFTIPVKADKEVTAEELKGRHLLLVGRPDSNPLVEKCRDRLPLDFGPRSFAVRGDHYANAGSAVIAAAENPLNPRYSVVVIAGLGGAATLRAAPVLAQRGQKAAEVLVVPNGGQPRALVVPPREKVQQIKGK